MVPPAGTTLHRLGDLSRRELRRSVRALDLDALLLNPERSRRFRGLTANVLRPGYGTENYRQKIRSFRTPLRSAGRRLLRMTPWVALERRWERAFYEDCDPPPEVIAVSEYMRREILDSYRVPGDRVHVIHNGVDLTEFNPGARARLRADERARHGIPDDAVVVLFMGHNYRLKGLWPLIRTVHRVRQRHPGTDLHLLVAGRGTGRGQRTRAAREIRDRGLDGVVHLAGPIRPAIRAFAAADLFVHLSWHDAFGFVTLEAMASGIPVVTTPYVGAAEVVDDGVAGLVVDPAREDAVEQALARLLDPDTRAAMGEAAAAVGRRHAEETNFRQVLDVIRAAARRGPRPG